MNLDLVGLAVLTYALMIGLFVAFLFKAGKNW